MKSETILKTLDLLIAALDLADDYGINAREVAEAQAIAKAENRPMSEAERQPFLDEAQDRLDDL